MNLITLTPVELGLAAVLVLMLAGLSFRLKLGVHVQILVAAARTVVQLLLVGFLLKLIFGDERLLWVALMSSVMLLVAGREVMARQQHRLVGWWGFGVGTVSMFVSSFAVTVLALAVIIGTEPWYRPQYAIPLLGMLLGNAMNGIALSLDRLTTSARERRAAIEGQLALGANWSEAIAPIQRQAVRAGMIPTINAMAAAGVVSLPGMMTGQILAGTAPMEAVKYQILVMFLITSGGGFGTLIAVWLAARRLFDDRQRLRLDRLRSV